MSTPVGIVWIVVGLIIAALAWRASADQVREGRQIKESLGKLVSVTEPSPVNILVAAAAKILTLDQAQTELTSKLGELQKELDETKTDLAGQKSRQQRTVSRDQWDAIRQVLTAAAQKQQRLSLSIKVPYGDLEAEQYGKYFMQIFSCGISYDNRIGPDLVGLVIRVRDRISIPPPTATYLSQALEAAHIQHRTESLDLQFPLNEFEAELVIGRNG